MSLSHIFDFRVLQLRRQNAGARVVPFPDSHALCLDSNNILWELERIRDGELDFILVQVPPTTTSHVLYRSTRSRLEREKIFESHQGKCRASPFTTYSKIFNTRTASTNMGWERSKSELHISRIHLPTVGRTKPPAVCAYIVTVHRSPPPSIKPILGSSVCTIFIRHHTSYRTRVACTSKNTYSPGTSFLTNWTRRICCRGPYPAGKGPGLPSSKPST